MCRVARWLAGWLAGWLGNVRCHSTLEIESDGLRPLADEYGVERLAVKHHFGMHVIRGDVSAMERCQKKILSASAGCDDQIAAGLAVDVGVP